MKIPGRVSTLTAICSVVALVMLGGCQKKEDAVSVAEQADKAAGVTVPGIAETRKIAEQGFIYGLPIGPVCNSLQYTTCRPTMHSLHRMQHLHPMDPMD